KPKLPHGPTGWSPTPAPPRDPIAAPGVSHSLSAGNTAGGALSSIGFIRPRGFEDAGGYGASSGFNMQFPPGVGATVMSMRQMQTLGADSADALAAAYRTISPILHGALTVASFIPGPWGTAANAANLILTTLEDDGDGSLESVLDRASLAHSAFHS